MPFLSSVAATVASWPAAAVNAAVVLGVAALALAIKRVFDTPSRTYNANVGQEYDRWTEEGILEYYWGEHIHLGYYTEEEQKRGYLKKASEDGSWTMDSMQLRQDWYQPSCVACRLATAHRAVPMMMRRTSSKPSTTLWTRC